MDSKRRKFLKIAGLGAIAGVTAPMAFNSLLKGEAFASGGHGHEEAHGSSHGSTAPKGKQYGLVVDVQKFADQPGLGQKCVHACHSLHNVPDYGNKKDEIKWIWIEKYENAFTEHSHYKRNEALHKMPIMTLCNHCANPPCVRACPTQATFKNKDGIVMMDYHRCIGCRFCMAACPYGARSFNWRDPRGSNQLGKPFIKRINPDYPTRMRGVVEKCTLCNERLAHGQLPACVDASNGAMIFGDLNDPGSEINKVLNEKFTIQRKPSAGTSPSIFYII
ncbi:MAG: 4Fe-4S dicluster domain-containing protein [Desulfobulbaceae bacterium]|nr:4Fe-4S dicluster domain-containing protein [Desulfobulbaceae bacterium]